MRTYEYRMPSLGADMDDGTVVEWLVKPGDTIHRGDVVANVETQKADLEAEIWVGGTVREILVPAGEKVSVGTPLARIATEESFEQEPAAFGEPRPERKEPQHISSRKEAHTAGRAKVRASPAARALAVQLDIDISRVKGSGPAGVVIREDVEQATKAQAPAKDRRAARQESIARLMARSKREIPHFYLESNIDLHLALQKLEAENTNRTVSERILPAALLLRATVLALEKNPELNGYFREGKLELQNEIHLGIAIALRGGGLIAPAIRNAAQKKMSQIMEELKDLVTRARAGRLRTTEMTEPTITVTNLGENGAELVHGIIYPPQVALIGFGRITERPWAVKGKTEIRPILCATLSVDHRVSDGHRGSRFLHTLTGIFGNPTQLFDEREQDGRRGTREEAKRFIERDCT